MSNARRLSIVCLILGAILPFLISGSTKSSINVRVLDAVAGRAMKNTSALLVKWDAKGQTEKLAAGTTNGEGIIAFQVSESLPDRVGLSFSPDEIKNCSELAFSTQTILADGVVGGNSCVDDNKKPTVIPRTGELSVFVKKVTLREKMRRELP